VEWKAILAVGIGGGIGAILRYAVGFAFVQRFGPGFPWGTLAINVSGSFLIGIIAQLALTRSFGVTPTVRLFAATGVLGGYTTFSTFSLDTIVLVGGGAFLVSAVYALGSVVAGVFGAYAGEILARLSVG
jgi:fluoride exporter